MRGKHAFSLRYNLAAGRAKERLRAARLGSFFRPGQIADSGLTRDQIPALVRRRVLTRVCRGLYRLADAKPTQNYPLAMACACVPNSVVCLVSALRVYGIGSQAPAEVWLGIPHNARTPRLPGLRMRIVHFSGPAWNIGVKAVEFEGVRAPITTPARTIADCFRLERPVGSDDLAIEVLREALGKQLVTIAELASVEAVLPSRRLRAQLDARLIETM
jgi:predicted transcriptional regulator of viral defense system